MATQSVQRPRPREASFQRKVLELARRTGINLGCVSYHVRYLNRLGLIELKGTRPRRGAVEHTYQLAERA